MLTGRVMTAAFLLNRGYSSEKLVDAAVKLVQEMSKDEMTVLKYYVAHGTFINHGELG